jgi:3-hydroxyacyl-CoA dehydrogenase
MNSLSIRRVTVAGAGVLGAQIAFQAAVHGFSLFLYEAARRSGASCSVRSRTTRTIEFEHDCQLIATPLYDWRTH